MVQTLDCVCKCIESTQSHRPEEAISDSYDKSEPGLNFFYVTINICCFALQVEIGQRRELSAGDAKQMNLMYNCPDKGLVF